MIYLGINPLISTATICKVKTELFLPKFNVTGIQLNTGIHRNYRNSPEITGIHRNSPKFTNSCLLQKVHQIYCTVQLAVTKHNQLMINNKDVHLDQQLLKFLQKITTDIYLSEMLTNRQTDITATISNEVN